MRRRDVAIAVLNEMQVLDQQVAPTRPLAEQRTDLVQCHRIDLPAFGMEAAAPPATAVLADFSCFGHRRVFLINSTSCARPLLSTACQWAKYRIWYTRRPDWVVK